MPLVLLLAALVGVFGLRLWVEPLAAEVVGLLGAVLAALAFAPGDPPRRPWALRALAVGTILLAHALQRLALGAPALSYGLIIAANLVGAAAVLGFLRVVRASGLAPALTPRERLVAAALCGGALVVVAQTLAALPGDASLRAVTVAVSALADALVFVTSALLLRVTLPLRGGLVAQPYLLLAVDGLFFLSADLALVAASDRLAAHLSAAGGAAGAAAGFAQVLSVRRSLQRQAPL